MTRMTSITLRVLSGIPFLAGSAAFLWGVFCFLGGPDGRSWSPSALIAWGVSWGIAAACAGLYLLLNRGSTRARRLLLIAWTALLGAAGVIGLLTAVFQGVPAAAFAPAVLLILDGLVTATLFRRKRP